MRYNPTIDGFDSFVLPSSIGKTHRFSSNVFYSITADPSGILWIGSRTSGIVRFNPKDLTFQVFSEEEGLVSNLVYAICVDEKTGNIWASGNKGLSCYDPQDNTVVNYSSNDGLQGDGFCFDASFVSAASEMYFGGYNGFNVFNPENIIMNDAWPKTTIVSYRENGEIKSRLIKNGDTIVLHSKDCVFGFEFSALDYATPHNSRYKFCLENHDERWTERESDERYVEYFQVSPGIYTFKVVASNSSNIWDEDGVAVTIIIRPRWNETLMFKIAVVLLIIMFIVLILILIISNIKNKLKMQEKYHEMEKQMFLLKQKSLQLQMNPHVLFNMLNSIQGYVLRNDSDSAVYYLNKFALLMRRILSNSTETYISLGKELDAIKLYIELEMMRFDNLFDYEITISPSIDVNYFEITPMILQPYVENAIIHGLRYKTSTGHLKITITNDALDTVLCTIEDNGVGRQRAMEIEREADLQRKSHGMRITQERLDMINQFTQDVYTVKVIDLLDHDGKPAGTRVEIRIFGKE
jgi:Putative regulator of cell autolysis